MRLVNTAAENRRDLDLDLNAVCSDHKLIHAALAGQRDPVRPRPADAAFDVCGGAPHRRVDILQGGGTVLDRQIGQIDIDRKARHIAYEQVDRRAAFQGETVLGRDERKDLDKQGDLTAIPLIYCHRVPSAP